MAEGSLKKLGLEYFGQQAYLSPAGILYQGILMAGDMGRVFEIAPVFYGEKSRGPFNLNEFNVIEYSMSFVSREDLMRVTEELIAAVVKEVQETCAAELELLGVSMPQPKLPFRRLTYGEMLDFLQSQGVTLEWSQFHEMPAEAIRAINGGLEDFFWVVDQPAEQKWFFQKVMIQDGRETSVDCQLWFPRAPYRIAEGGEREVSAEQTERQIELRGLEPAWFEPYLDALKHGTPPFCGIGIGVERLVALLLNQHNIREVVLFPRDPDTIL